MTTSSKLVVVTGAASGIGGGLAREAIKRGHRVLMADYDEAALVKSANDIAGAEAVVTDVTDPAQVDALADRADALGGADLLFNNAGVMSTGFSWEIPVAAWERSMRVNVGGVLNGARSFIPRMIARGKPAHIINTSSVGGFLPSPLMAPYSATKFAIVAITESMMCELDMLEAPITVSLLAPGPVHSAIFENPFAGTVHPATKGFVDYMQEMSDEHGMDPDAFAALVFVAIERGDYWIIPQPETLDPLLAQRNAMIRERRKPVGSVVMDGGNDGGSNRESNGWSNGGSDD